jgi:uncharacterized membrane protein YeiH
MAGLVMLLDLLGVAVFAATGALTASRKQLDIVGFALLAAVTGIGGGTLRDLLIGRAPVFWVTEPVYLAVTTTVAVAVFVSAHLLESRYRALLWLDALGLALFSVLGAASALGAARPEVAVLMGVMTATFGGVIRDIICAEIPLVLRREIYVSAAFAGAALHTGLSLLGAGQGTALLAGAVLAFAVRAVGLWFGLSLPTYRARPGRPGPAP